MNEKVHSDYSHGRSSRPTSDELEQISNSLRGLRFGSVHIVVQDGIVIQIERTEKQRLRKGNASTINSPDPSRQHRPTR
jgi:hypothetical protein